MNSVYLDANASYGSLEEILSELTPWYNKLFNPNAIHSVGQEVMAAIESSREALAELSGCSLRDFRIVFNSGATEANNTAFNLCFERGGATFEKGTPTRQSDYQIVTSAIEHPSVLALVDHLHLKCGINSKLVFPDGASRFTAESFLRHISDSTRIVSLMFANNETGEILPVAEIAREIKTRYPNVLIHCDAVQGLGKVKQDFSALGVDMLSFSGHKLGGFPGVGALILKRGIECVPFIRGGSQESRWRAGTQNSPGILSFGLACKYVRENLDARIEGMEQRKSRFIELLGEMVPGVEFNLFGEKQIPNTLNLRLPGLSAADLLVALDLERVYASAGSACSSGKPLAAEALVASGLLPEQAKSSLRFSWRADEPMENFEYATRVIKQIVAQMGGIHGEAEQNHVA